MARGVYTVKGADTNTDNTTILYFAQSASPTTRVKLLEVMIGSIAAPADQACGYEIQRLTDEDATPGGSAVTPHADDPAAPAAACTAVSGPANEPTYTAGAYLAYLPLNQRTPFRWVVQPGRAILVPAAEDNGVGVVADTPTTAFVAAAVMVWEE